MAPPATTFRDDKPSLLVSWWCTLYSLTVICFRILGRYIRTHKIFLEDKIMLLAVIPLISRMCIETVVAIHGTNNVNTTGLTAAQIHSRELGSKLVLVSRILYILFLWTVKCSITIFLKTLTAPIWTNLHQIHLHYLHFFLFITLVLTISTTLTPFQPFKSLWQVVPDPVLLCRQNYIQTITLGALNVLTNVVLVVFPFPMVLMSGLPMVQKTTILLRFSIPILPIALTIYALPYISGTDPTVNSHMRRTLITSFDILLTAFCANAIVLFSLLQDKGYKKSKFKFVRGSLDAKKSANPPYSPRRRDTVDDMSVELCDVGNLLNEMRLVGGKDSVTDIERLEARACRERKDSEVTRHNDIENQPSTFTSLRTSLCKKEKYVMTDNNQRRDQQALVKENWDQIGNTSRREISCSGKTNASNTCNVSENEIQILVPAPVLFGDNKSA